MLEELVIYNPMYVTGFWTLLLLCEQRRKNYAKSFLCIFMFVAFLLYLSHAFFFKKMISEYQIFDSVYLFSSLLVYPLYYMYTRLLTKDEKINAKQLWHFVPAGVLLSLQLLAYYFIDDPANYVKSQMGLAHKTFSNWEQFQYGVFVASRFVFLIQIFVYCIMGLKLIQHYQNRISNFYSNLEGKSVSWAKKLFILFALASVSSAVLNIIGRSFFLSSYWLALPSTFFSILLFFIGYYGHLQHYTVVDLIREEHVMLNVDNPDLQYVLKQRLLHAMENLKIYRQPDLKIIQLCILLQTNRTYVSNLINREYNCSFSDFVNKYRCIEAKQILSDINSKDVSIADIAIQTGFGSLNTFIRFFKKNEGTTPGLYRKNMLGLPD